MRGGRTFRTFLSFMKAATLSPLDAIWHLSNLFLPAWGVAALMALVVKVIWRKDASQLSWRTLLLWGGAGGSMATVLAVIALGRDGSMAGYGLMVLGVTLPLWGLTLRR